jgi:hypothetical protein
MRWKRRPGRGATRHWPKELNSGTSNLNANQSLAVGDGRTRFERWRAMCPYGQWTTAEGREVLFNRDYCPILQRWPGEYAFPADLTEWVPWVKQKWFYSDGTPREFIKTIVDAVLVDWGMPPLPPMPARRTSGRPPHERRLLPNPYVEMLAEV